MNDVLPKPFTKEGLLTMLEKHLAHLKKIPDGITGMVTNPPSSIAQNSSAHSIKDEASPAQSPSTISTWNSPGQFSGISPTGSTQFVPQQVHAPAGYHMDSAGIQFQPSQSPLAAQAPRATSHQRQVSEMSGVDDIVNEPKRARMYAQTNAAMTQMRRGPAA
jgi:osomolarity two-component system response regulator SKN7